MLLGGTELPGRWIAPKQRLHNQHAAVAVLDVNLRGKLVYPFAEWLQLHGVPFPFCRGMSSSMIISATAIGRQSESR